MVCAGARSFWRPREAGPSPPPKEAANKYISIVYAPEAAGPSSNLQGGQTLRAPAQTSCLLSQRPQEAKGLPPCWGCSSQLSRLIKHTSGMPPKPFDFLAWLYSPGNVVVHIVQRQARRFVWEGRAYDFVVSTQVHFLNKIYEDVRAAHSTHVWLCSPRQPSPKQLSSS